MAINFHGQRTAVTVTKPFAHGWNINARFNAKRGEQMPQAVVSQRSATDTLARPNQWLSAHKDAANGVLWLWADVLPYILVKS